MKKVSLLEHEVHCYLCKGTGRKKFNRHNLCPKCDGYGTMDWIDNITGRIRKKKLTRWGENHTFIGEGVVEAMTKQLAEDIDNRIIKGLIHEAKQNNLQKLQRIRH